MFAVDFGSLALSALAIALVAVMAFFVGRRQGWGRPRRKRGRQDQARALAVAQELDDIAQRLRAALASHEPAVNRFHRKIDRLEQGVDGTLQDVFDRADELLKPTLRLSVEISHAYAEVLRQMSQLASLAELRSDPLTRINNRRAFDESLDNLLREQVRYPATFSLALIDIDQFKRVNDEHGHLHGDRMLQRVVQILKDNVRDCDILARYGGEEFAVLMPRTELHGACNLAERVRADLARQLPITASIGLAASMHGDDAASLIGRADRALYAAKHAGRNRVFLHDSHSEQLVGIRTTSPTVNAVDGSESPVELTASIT
jgi:diguanylate cyclase (GGDEF)-like protein